jgi:hypothetical protein
MNKIFDTTHICVSLRGGVVCLYVPALGASSCVVLRCVVRDAAWCCVIAAWCCVIAAWCRVVLHDAAWLRVVAWCCMMPRGVA